MGTKGMCTYAVRVCEETYAGNQNYPEPFPSAGSFKSIDNEIMSLSGLGS